LIPTIIHNPANEERHQHLLKQLEFAGVTEYEFSEPVYGRDPQMAVAQAHVNAARQSYERHGYCFVMENDIVFTHKDSVKYFLSKYNQLPERWDVYLMGYYYHNRNFREAKPFRELRSFTAFHGYILNPNMIDRMLPHEGSRIKNVDVYLNYLGAITYAIHPVVAIQNHDIKSERLGKHKRYDGLIKKLTLFNGDNGFD
jgi:hypothetical protein